MREQLEKFAVQVDELRVENKQLQDQNNRVEAEKIDLLNQLAALRAVPPVEQQSEAVDGPIDPPSGGGDRPEPAWMASWRQAETFERDAGIF